MRNLIILSTAIACCAFAANAHDLKAEVSTEHNLWWEAPEVPCVKFSLVDTLHRSNANSVVTLRVTLDRDESQPLMTIVAEPNIKAGHKQELSFFLNFAEPGFYKCFIEDDGNIIEKFNIGYEPTLVLSLPDSKPDFDAFWTKALAELAQVPGNFTMEEAADYEGKHRKAYNVTMQSLGNETIRGILFVPIKPGKYPAMINYHGYRAKPRHFDVDANPDMVELYTSVRGQFLCEPENKYGEWINYSLDNPDQYYYKGAYMDAVRAIDFIAQLPQVDTARIFAQGGSQGGALTLAAAALDDRLRAIMPQVPFLSDFPDYFKIVKWPANVVTKEAQRLGMSEEMMYENLSYFDLKNLARRITCPVLMGIGLQDGTCPPHTNVASYALIRAPKELIIYPTNGHSVDAKDWTPRVRKFINKWSK